jgi:hypothetical protein
MTEIKLLTKVFLYSIKCLSHVILTRKRWRLYLYIKYLFGHHKIKGQHDERSTRNYITSQRFTYQCQMKILIEVRDVPVKVACSKCKGHLEFNWHTRITVWTLQNSFLPDKHIAQAKRFPFWSYGYALYGQKNHQSIILLNHFLENHIRKQNLFKNT